MTHLAISFDQKVDAWRLAVVNGEPVPSVNLNGYSTSRISNTALDNVYNSITQGTRDLALSLDSQDIFSKWAQVVGF